MSVSIGPSEAAATNAGIESLSMCGHHEPETQIMRQARLCEWWHGGIVAAACGAAISAAGVSAQPPPGEQGRPSSGVDAAVARLMEYDADGNGTLSGSELSDSRLRALFQRADRDNNGTLTKSELTEQLNQDLASIPRGPRGPGDRGQGPGARGPVGPQPGQILPPFLQDELNLTDAQRRELRELQRDVDARLARILTGDQQRQLRQMRDRGPGGPPGRGTGGAPAGGRPQRP